LIDYSEALSVSEYEGDGHTTVWTFSFVGAFLSRDHVIVDIITGERAYQPIAFAWIDDSTIKIEPAIQAHQKFRIRPSTPRGAPLLDFTDGVARLHGDGA